MERAPVVSFHRGITEFSDFGRLVFRVPKTASMEKKGFLEASQLEGEDLKKPHVHS